MRADIRALAVGLAAGATELARGAMLGMAVLAALYPGVVQSGRLAGTLAPAGTTTPLRAADFGGAQPSAGARSMADWIAAAADNGGRPFVVVDKKQARLYVFDRGARLLATTPVLLGAALGDESAPGIGDRPMALVRPEERTTPAGRFVAERGRNARGEDVVWVDYGAAVSMHRVVTAHAAERRLERLASPTASDNRISYGCINVPVAFYEAYIRPAFADHTGIVYVLPDWATIHQVFGA